jgi:hypothetical protein
MRLHPKGPVGTPRASKCWYRPGSWILSSESMLSAGVIVAAVAIERSVGRLVVALITSPHSPSFLSSPLLFHSLPPLPFLLSLLLPSPYSPSFSLLSFLSSPSLTLPLSLTCDVCWWAREGSMERVSPPHEH